MNTIINRIKIALCVLVLSGNAYSQSVNIRERADKVCKFFIENKTDSVHFYFNEDVKQKMTASQLSNVWMQVKQQMGAVEEYNAPINKVEIGKYFYSSVFTFENMQLELRLPFNEQGYLMGLFFSPVQNASQYKLPVYTFKGKFSETPLMINNGDVKLKAMITKPDTKKYPCVILVHGSGPGDMDETINNNKPFKDIAIGLAQQGVATIRYDKRTFVYKQDSLINTPTKEVVSDAVAAYNLALQQEGVDKNNIFILGHSLGGYLAPSIAQSCKGIKGIILMAAPARALEDIIYDQFNYILGLDSLDNDEKRKLNDLKISVDIVKNNKYTLQTPSTELPLQIGPVYWMELSYYKPLELIKNLKIDVLVLNGSNDYQVTNEDFELWKKALAENKEADFKYYKGLYHLFMKGDRLPSDYEKISNVEEEVIKDIAEFVK